MRALTLIGAVAALAVAIAAAGPQRTQASRTPVFESTLCPTAIVQHAIGTARCGFLTVPENRSKPNGRTIRLFVVREKPTPTVPADPVLAVWELGLARTWTESDALPTRVRREVVTIDPRGLGRSEPSLDCPEIERLARSSLVAPINDARTRGPLLSAVHRCRARLATQGIELGAFNLAESAADAKDLRVALGIDRWSIGAYGSGSRLALELVRRDAAHIRALYLDSPESPQVDLLTSGITGTRYAVKKLAAACRAHRGCNRRFPRLEHALARLLRLREQRPLPVWGAYHGVRLTAALDGGTMLRALREVMAHDARLVPLALHTPDRTWTATRQDWITDGPLFALGYAADAGTQFGFGHGAYFSTVCRDQLAFVSQAALRRLTVGAPAYREAFAESPFHDICRIWKAGGAKEGAREPVVSTVPTLVLVSRIDPYASTPLARQAIRDLSRSWLVEFRSGGNHVIAHSDCARLIRNTWIDAPSEAPDTTCVKRVPPIKFALEW